MEIINSEYVIRSGLCFADKINQKARMDKIVFKYRIPIIDFSVGITLVISKP